MLLRSKKHPPRQTRTHFFLFFVICSALARATFFVLLHVPLNLHLYFFVWFLPEFLNLAAFVMLLRSWIRVWATSRHLATFTYRSTRVKLFVIEVTTITFIEVAQAVVFLVMIILGEGYFDLMQRVDAWYMGALELLLILSSGVCMGLVKYLEKRAKRRHDIIEIEQSFLSLFNRVLATSRMR
ncbi:uncharacterized protein ACA1_270370 [Acanthamoeba castellanii str. Neff]|uniref:Uncharacterized protein n=1 Tax=Acanthamoeba castellanii (strain ATCC 30010 / Neff) TaxID=1257118 RepID=L8H2V1_ACACF|nr:uncharacterized protein ACA1_270370 [Acanthamoeba castellanii str. Neff]ELR19562.1 hypothetical protein ACA1_270370 [Acanthamoeba castellanii str. Neff]